MKNLIDAFKETKKWYWIPFIGILAMGKMTKLDINWQINGHVGVFVFRIWYIYMGFTWSFVMVLLFFNYGGFR